MNKPNNTDEAIIHAAFAAMVEGKKPVSKITVREICERAQINRSTFYAHYMDVYDLFEKVESQMAQMFQENFRSFEKSGESWDFLLAMERVFQFGGPFSRADQPAEVSEAGGRGGRGDQLPFQLLHCGRWGNDCPLAGHRLQGDPRPAGGGA